MKKPGNILIVDDNRGVLTAVQLLLKPPFRKDHHAHFTCHTYLCVA